MVVHEALETTCMVESYSFSFTPTTKCGVSPDAGAVMTTLVGPPGVARWAEADSAEVKAPDDSITIWGRG